MLENLLLFAGIQRLSSSYAIFLPSKLEFRGEFREYSILFHVISFSFMIL